MNNIQPPSLFSSIDEFEFIEGKKSELGRGSFAVVRLARCKRDGRLYAIKSIKIDGDKHSSFSKTIIEREVTVHKALNHPNIVRLYESIWVI